MPRLLSRIPVIEHRCSSEKAVVLCHGITSEKTEGGVFNELVHALSAKSFSTIQFDLPGHGESNVPSDLMSVAEMLGDLTSVMHYAQRVYSEVSIVAASFGAAVSILHSRLAGNASARKLLLVNPVTSFKDSFWNSPLPWGVRFVPSMDEIFGSSAEVFSSSNPSFALGRRFLNELLTVRIADAESLPDPQNTFAIHGESDQVISIEQTARFVLDQRIPAENFQRVVGAGHGFTGFEPIVFDFILKAMEDGYTDARG